MKISFVKKIRDEVKFGSLDALREQLEKDRSVILNDHLSS
jgi:FAD synthase